MESCAVTNLWFRYIGAEPTSPIHPHAGGMSSSQLGEENLLSFQILPSGFDERTIPINNA